MKATDYLNKAEHALSSAKHLLAAGESEGAANRAYYAMYHAAHAALPEAGEDAIGKHGTIIGRFGLVFVKNGPLPTELGRAMHEAQQLRSIGDYQPTAPDPDAVKLSVASAEEFLSAVRDLIKSIGSKK